MPCGATLYFDNETDAAIRRIWQAIEDAGLRSEMLQLTYPPHLTLMLCEDIDLDRASELLPKFVAENPPLPVTFYQIGTFGGPEAAFFLSPTPTRPLLNFHAGLWQQLEKCLTEPNEYYRPDNWVPHVTVNINVPNDQAGPLMDVLLRTPWPRYGLLREIALADFHSEQSGFTELFKARLGSYL